MTPTAPARIRKMAHCVVDPVRQEIRTPFENELPVPFGEIERVALHKVTKRWLGIVYHRWQVSLELKDGETVQLWEYAKERTARETMGMFRKNTDLPLWDCTTDTPTPYSAADIQARMLCQSLAEDAPPIAPPEGLSVKALTNEVLAIHLPGPSRPAVVRSWIYKLASLFTGTLIGLGLAIGVYSYLPFFTFLGFIYLSPIALFLCLKKIRLAGFFYGVIFGALLFSGGALLLMIYPAGGVNGLATIYLTDTDRYIGTKVFGSFCVGIPLFWLAWSVDTMDFPRFRPLYFLTATQWLKATPFHNQEMSLWNIQDIRIDTDPQSGLKHLVLVHDNQNTRLTSLPLKEFPLEETVAYLRQEIAGRQRAMVKAADELEASL